LAFDDIESDYPFFLSIPQARTVEILRKSLDRYPSVIIRDGVKFTGLEQSDESVRVALCDVRTETQFRACADFVVGCDGHRSKVCAALGLKAREKTYAQRFIMADFLDASGLGAEARLFFSSEGSIESFPLPGGWRRWIVQAREWRNPAPLQYLTRAVQRLAGVDLSRHPARFVSESWPAMPPM
jgi:2-polyprenyl-6-methoxyphenol hydroxylase-like FAD-dependent oxidoreductase